MFCITWDIVQSVFYRLSGFINVYVYLLNSILILHPHSPNTKPVRMIYITYMFNSQFTSHNSEFICNLWDIRCNSKRKSQNCEIQLPFYYYYFNPVVIEIHINNTFPYKSAYRMRVAIKNTRGRVVEQKNAPFHFLNFPPHFQNVLTRAAFVFI